MVIWLLSIFGRNSCRVVPFGWFIASVSGSDLLRIKEISTSNLRNNCNDGTYDLITVIPKCDGSFRGKIRID